MAAKFIIRATTYIVSGESKLPRYARICDEEGQTVSYSRAQAENTVEELIALAKEQNVDVKYDVIPDPNQE